MAGSAPRVNVLVLINELYIGGDENRLLALGATIDRTRYALTVATIKAPNPAVESQFGTMRAAYEDADIEVVSLGEGHPNYGVPLTSLRRHVRAALMFVRSVAKTWRLVRQRRIDVLDCHGGPGVLVGTVVGALARKPVAMTTYNVEQWEPRWLWRIVHAWTLRRAAAVVTDSEAVADVLRTWIPANKSKVRVIPNGACVPIATRELADVRRLLDIPADPKIRVIGTVASFFESKGHFVLLDAVPDLLQRHPNVIIVMVGFVRHVADYRERLFARAKELGIEDHVRVISYPGSIGDIWPLFDIHAHPTLLDSLPNAIMEGMSLGKAAVVTAVGGIPTMVEDGVTGIVVPPNDPRALSVALDRLLAEPALAARLGASAQRRYEKEYTPQIMSRRIEALFSQLAATRW